MPVPHFGRRMRTSPKSETNMDRRQFFLSLSVAVAAAPMAWAQQSYADLVIKSLADQGYSNFKIGATLLGRIRIVADSANGRREIILNPKTGEILRDVFIDAAGNPIVSSIFASETDGNTAGGNTSGSDDDNSGSGSGGSVDDNSGSGSDGDSSGSGSDGDSSGSGSDGDSSGSGSDDDNSGSGGDGSRDDQERRD